MLYKDYPFNGRNEQELFNCIEKTSNINFDVNPKVKLSENCKDLIRRLL